MMFNEENALVNVFIDADCVSGVKRRHIIQKLESLGGKTVKDPKYARFIVVPPESELMRDFVDCWPDKTYVYLSWIDASIVAGRLLVEDEAWNSHLATEYLHRPKPESKSDTASSLTLVGPSQPSAASPIPQMQLHPQPAPAVTTPAIDPAFSLASHEELVNLASQLPADILQQAIERRQNVDLNLAAYNLSAAANLPPPPTDITRDAVIAEKPAKRLKISPHLPFENPSGKPYSFYVQVDGFKGRPDFIALIKTHGGSITPYIETADFAILSKNSKDFNTMLGNRLATGKPGLSSQFVLDSVEKGTLLDADDYKFDVPPQLLSRAQQSLSSRSVAKRPEPPVKAETKSTPPLRSLSRSPTPPPESTRVKSANRGYRYPEVELEFVRNYLPILLSRDRSISNTEIAKRLHVKMNHHSPSAWGITLSNRFYDQLYQLRSEVRRSAGREENSQDFENDLEMITNFFAFEVPGDLDDEQRYHLLGQKARPKTVPTWRQFFDRHRDAVAKRFAQKVE